MILYIKILHGLVIVYLFQLFGRSFSIDDNFDPLAQSILNNEINQTAIRKVLTYHPANDPDSSKLMLEMINRAGLMEKEPHRTTGRDLPNNKYNINNNNYNNDQFVKFNLSAIDIKNITDMFQLSIVITSVIDCWEALSVDKQQQLQTSLKSYLTKSHLLNHDLYVTTSAIVNIIRSFFRWSLHRLDNSNTSNQCGASNNYNYHHHINKGTGIYNLDLRSLLNYSEYSVELKGILLKVASYWDDVEVNKKERLVNAFTIYVRNNTSIDHDIVLVNTIFVEFFSHVLSLISGVVKFVALWIGVLSLIGAFYVMKFIFRSMKYILSAAMPLFSMTLVMFRNVTVFSYVILIIWIAFNDLVE